MFVFLCYYTILKLLEGETVRMTSYQATPLRVDKPQPLICYFLYVESSPIATASRLYTHTHTHIVSSVYDCVQLSVLGHIFWCSAFGSMRSKTLRHILPTRFWLQHIRPSTSADSRLDPLET